MRVETPLPNPPHILDVSSCQEGSWCQVVIASYTNPFKDEPDNSLNIKITARLRVIARIIQGEVDDAEGMTLIQIDRKYGELQFSFRKPVTWQL